MKDLKQFAARAIAARVLTAALQMVVRVLGAASAVAHVSAAAASAFAPAHSTPLTEDARYMRQWVLDSRDAQQQPFAVVDKKAARMYVFDATGGLLGTTQVLLGQGRGDHSVPGVADIPDLNQIPVAHRTTPAGRFASRPGHNLSGEAIVWIDYQAALAIHRVRPGSSQGPRMARLATPGAGDKRASLGCVVVPPAFYDAVVAPSLGRQRGVVYVLPELQPVQALFGAAATVATKR